MNSLKEEGHGMWKMSICFFFASILSRRELWSVDFQTSVWWATRTHKDTCFVFLCRLTDGSVIKTQGKMCCASPFNSFFQYIYIYFPRLGHTLFHSTVHTVFFIASLKIRELAHDQITGESQGSGGWNILSRIHDAFNLYRGSAKIQNKIFENHIFRWVWLFWLLYRLFFVMVFLKPFWAGCCLEVGFNSSK